MTALNQHMGWNPEARAAAQAQDQLPMVLPREALAVLEGVYAGHADCLLLRHVD